MSGVETRWWQWGEGMGVGGRVCVYVCVCVWGGGGRQERGLEVQDHGISSGFSYHMNIGLYND